MSRFGRWVLEHGGWLKAPIPQRATPDYNSLHYRICRRDVSMRVFSRTLRQCVDVERSHPVRQHA